jgi:hypothetical protein
VLMPESGCLGMSLKVLEDGDDVSFRDGFPFEMLCPPFLKLCVNLHVK